MASEANRVLKVIFMGVDELNPTINRINGSLTNFGRQTKNTMDGASRSTGLLNEQFKVLRRTAEHAVAAFSLYKIYQAVAAYKSFRSELGLLNANLMTTEKNLTSIGQSAIQVSAKTATPLNDVLETYRNLASTFPGLSNNKLKTFAAVESKTSRILQVQPQDIGAAIGGLATTFYGRKALQGPQGENIIKQISDMLVKTRFTNPNLTGEDITRFIPALGGFASAAQFDLPQTLALFSGVQRQLINPATSAQYLRQLMIRIRKPTPGAQKFFDQAGLDTKTLASLPGNEILNKLLEKGLSLPGSNMTFEEAKKSGFKPVQLKDQAAQFFMNTVGGRQQSLVAVTGIVKNLGQVITQEQFLIRKSSGETDKAWSKWLSENRFTQASIAFNAMTVSMLDDMNPVLQKAAQITAQVTTWAALRANPALKHLAGGIGGVEQGALGALGAPGNTSSRFHLGGLTEVLAGAASIYGLKRIGGFKALTKIPGISKLFGKGASGESLAGKILGPAIRGPLDIQALSSAFQGQANGTATAPFWVVIHPLSMQTVPGMFGGRGRGGGSGSSTTIDQTFDKMGRVGASAYTAATASKAARAISSKSGLTKFLSRFGPGASVLLKHPLTRALGPAAAITSYLSDPGNLANPGGAGIVSMGDYVQHVQKGGYLDQMFNPQGSQLKKALWWKTHKNLLTSPKVLEAERQWMQGNMTDKQFAHMLQTADPNSRLNQLSRSKADAQSFWPSDTSVKVILEPNGDLSKLIKPKEVRIAIPTKLQGVASPAPTSRGKTTSRNET